MVVGSYTIVNERLKRIPPGLIDHREWTPTNGHNNLLRVNGMGAPRAFDLSVIRRFGFPNVSYGEDYAVALRITLNTRRAGFMKIYTGAADGRTIPMPGFLLKNKMPTIFIKIHCGL